MPAIDGKTYIARIDGLNADVWYNGEKVTGKLSEHPAFKGIIKTQAELYDLQHDPRFADLLTAKTASGDRVGRAYLAPKTKEDLERRRLAAQHWARHTAGMLGRSPDYMNTVVMAFGTAADLFKTENSQAADNLKRYYEYAMTRDISLTHTFVTPQSDRSSLFAENPDEIIGARMIEENKDGIVVHGARLLATQGATTEEILVFPTGARLPRAKAARGMAYAFTLPNNTPGLSFICRDSFVGSDSAFDHPLSSRFEEMDTIVVFDRVTVPWERVFLHGDVEVNNRIYQESGFYPLTTHHVVSKSIVKIEFFLGLMQAIIDSINIGEYQHVHEKVSEAIIALEAMKGFVLSAEQNAKENRWGVMTPDPNPLQAATIYFAKTYPRLVEIVKQLGASGLVSTPSEAAFQSEIGSALRRYLKTTTGDGEAKTRLFRLAWDATMSAFGSRQELYERFFFGDPVRRASTLFYQYDRKAFAERIQAFLEGTPN